MFESADGSWLVQGTTGNSGKQNTALIRLSPDENAWIMEVLPSMVPRAISPAKFLYSANSEYDLIIMAAAVSSAQGADAAMTGMMKRVNLVRIQPTEASPYEVWYMQENSDAFGDVTMVRSETYLQYFQKCIFDKANPEIPSEYNMQEELMHPSPSIYNACFSPDGKYALLYTRQAYAPESKRDRLYLLSLETMEVIQVEVPEETISNNLAAGTPLGRRYEPGMVWHSDGALVILTKRNGIRLFHLTVH